MDPGETLVQAGIREVKEETNMDVRLISCMRCASHYEKLLQPIPIHPLCMWERYV